MSNYLIFRHTINGDFMKTKTNKPSAFLILYFISTGFYANRILTRFIFQNAGKWAWLYIWGLSLIILGIGPFIYRYMQKVILQSKNKEANEGYLAKGVKICLYIYLFISCFLCLSFLLNLTNIGWLFETSTLWIMLPLLFIIYYVLNFRFDVLLRLSTLFIFPIIMQYLIFVFAKNKSFDLYAIIPFSTDDIRSIFTLIIAGLSMILDLGLCLFYFDECATTIKKRYYYAVILFHIFSLCFDSLIATGQFGVLISDLPFVYYESWRVINFGQFIVYLDTLAFFYWVTSAFCRLALSFYLIKKMTLNYSWLYLFSYIGLGIATLYILNHGAIYTTLRIYLLTFSTLALFIALVIKVYLIRKRESK